MKQLQKRQYRLLLQVHDFAEDGRPHLFYPDPYPADCHYAVINSRDYHALISAGASPSGVHLLPNMVAWPESQQAQRPPSELILYPIRAIRRKNIGEAILLSLFFKHGEKLAITLPPNSPADFPSYEGWKRLVAQRNLSIEFESGLHSNFPELVRTARMLITTSVMEGFGLTFLEPWLAGKLLWGRMLPEICVDFEQNGVRLEHLYTALNVPLEWIDKDRYRVEWMACVQKASDQFNARHSRVALETAFGKITAEDQIDFGLLNEFYQKQVIARVLDEPDAGPQMIALNPWLADPGGAAGGDDLIAANREAVQQHYGSGVCRNRLMRIYRKVAETPVSQRIDKQELLEAFFDLHSFSLLKWGPYVE